MTWPEIEHILRTENIPEDAIPVMTKKIWNSFGGRHLSKPEIEWLARHLKEELPAPMTKERFFHIFQEEGIDVHWTEAYWSRAVQRNELLDEESVRTLARDLSYGNQGDWG